MSYGYKDNYPHNIEAPQRVNFQYSHDITFDYNDGRYPLGEEYEGFLWEKTYIPVEHYVNNELIGKHVWMRTSVGSDNNWTLPMRFTDSFTNIEQTDVIIDETTDKYTYSIKYTLTDGTVIISDPITVSNGVDGVGITNAIIINKNLIITYSNGIIENLGKVVGEDGTGVPATSTPGNIPTYDVNGLLVMQSFISILNDNLSATAPIDYTNGLISHSNADGDRHIPIGGNNGDNLVTDGAGNYIWEPPISLNDYYTKTELGSVGDANYVNWDKVFNEPSFLTSWTASGNSGNATINLASNNLSIVGTGSVSTSLVGHILTISSTGGVYTEGPGLTLTGNQFSHANTSSQGPLNNSNGIVIQDLGFDTYGHVTSANSIDLDNRYSLLNHTHLSLVDGEGLENFSYNGSTDVTINVDFGSGHLQAARGDHTHSSLVDGNGINDFSYNGGANATISVAFGGNGTATTVSRSDHTHNHTTVGYTGDITWKDKDNNDRYGTFVEGLLKATGPYVPPTPASGSISPSFIVGVDGSTHIASVIYSPGTTSSTWGIRFLSGDSIATFSPNNGSGNTNVSVTLNGPPAFTGIYELYDVLTGVQLDTIETEIHP